MTSATARMITPLLLGAALTVVGCSSGPENPTSGGTTTTTTSRTGAAQAECLELASKAGELLTVTGRLATGDATTEEVGTAASELADTFDDVAAAAGPQVQAQLDEAGEALQRVRDALAAQPVDTTALRAAAGDAVTALSDAATFCTGGSVSTTDSAIGGPSNNESTQESESTQDTEDTANTETTTTTP